LTSECERYNLLPAHEGRIPFHLDISNTRAVCNFVSTPQPFVSNDR